MRNLVENLAPPPTTLTKDVIFNLNQLLILLSSSGEDSKIGGSSPQDASNSIINKIKEWVHNLVHKFDELFPPETRDEKVHDWLKVTLHWLGIALPYLILILCLCCCGYCCCPCVRGFWRKCCCCCCRRRGGGRMMRAPGRGGDLMMPRNLFEDNPRLYFQNLRSGKSIDELF